MNSITLLFIFVPILVIILLMANVLLAAHRPDTEKVTAYECGFSPIYGQTRAPFSIQYYLVRILFLVFDLEILLFYPLAVTLYNVSLYGFWIAVIFFLVLTLGFVYELGVGALYFTDHRSSIRPTNISSTTPETPNQKSANKGLFVIVNYSGKRSYSTYKIIKKSFINGSASSTIDEIKLVSSGTYGSTLNYGKLNAYMGKSTIFPKLIKSPKKNLFFLLNWSFVRRRIFSYDTYFN